jgi:predicted GNAT family N-acyltransferase
MSPRTALQIRLAADAAERDAALALRHRVFCEEQGVPVPLEVDKRDAVAMHLVAVRDGVVLGTCRLLFDGATAKVGRMAVEPAARRAGIGSELLSAALDEARRAGSRRASLNAQVAAVGLYARAGFVVTGEPFEEAGIDHVRMERSLA